MSQPPSSQSPLSAREVPSSFADNQAYFDESRWQRFTRRLKEEPLIPLGCGVTCWALWGATKSIRKGDSVHAQKMFRMRCYAQLFTVVAMIAGSFYYNSDRILRKEYEEVIKERKAIDKRNAWIRELEARDREEKDWREKVKEVTEKRKAEEDVARAKIEASQGGGVVTKAVKGLKERLARDGEGGDGKVKEVTEKRKAEEDVARAKIEASKGGGVMTKAVEVKERLAGDGEGGGGKP